MGDINKFLGGLDTDAHPNQQKEHTIRYGLNFVPMAEDGNLYSITNESGTELMSNIKFPLGFKPIGHSILNNDIIVILCNASGKSQIGYIVEDSSPDPVYGFYHPSGPISNTTGDVLENNSELGFKQTHPVDCVSRKLINGHRLLYFTDNQVPYGYFDLDDPPIEGVVSESVKLTFDQKIPNINVIEIKEGVSSSIRAGVVQFITRYVTSTGDTTVFGLPSEVFPMVPSIKTDGANSYHGEFYGSGTVNKNLVVRFDNVDTKYQELEVVALFYESEASVFKACVVGQIPIPETGVTASLDFTYTGPNTDSLIKLTREELQQVIVSYTHAKCIEQKDNHLFLSNLRDERVKASNNLQTVANAIKVNYRVEDIQYSGRGTNGGLAGDPLFFDKADGPYTVSQYEVELIMNQDAAASTVIPANFQLKKDGSPALGKITATTTAGTAGDTITITMVGGYTGAQVNFALTAIASGAVPLNNEYIIGTTKEETAENIFNALTDSTSVTDFIPSYFPGADYVELIWSTKDLTVNASTVVSSNTAAITTVDFTGASTTVTTTVAIGATVSGDTINVSFGTTVVLIGDELLVGTPTELLAAVSSAGTFTTGNVNGLPIAAEGSSGAGAFATEPGFTDYTNEFLTATKKGYRRGEVYSLGFKILYKDGSMSPAFHIPGEADYIINLTENKFPPTALDVWPTINEGSGTGIGVGRVGTYVSEDTYPLDQGYPGNIIGDDLDTSLMGPAGKERNVRHHYMPRLVNEPHFTNTSASNVNDIGSEKIRVLGLEFDFTKPIPNDILEQADEIIFLRERRNTDNNKSIYAQGVVHKHMITADKFSNDGLVGGTAIPGNSFLSGGSMRDGYCITELPFFNLNFAIEAQYGVEKNGARSTWGRVVPINDVNPYDSEPNSHLPVSGGTYSNGKKFASQTIKNQVMFYSPESVLLSGFTLNAEQIKNYSLTEELIIVGKIDQVIFKPDWQRSTTPAVGYNKHRIDKYAYGDFFCQYTKVSSLNGSPSNTHTIQDARYLAPNILRNISLDPDNPALKTCTSWVAGGLQLYLNNDISPAMDEVNGIWYYDYSNLKTTKNDVSEGVSRVEYQSPSTTSIPDKTPFSSFIKNVRNLYNVQINNTKQYGQVNNASYIPIGRFPIKNSLGSFVTSYSNIYGGDTFITKFSFNAGAMINYRPFYDTGLAPINSYDGSNTQRPGGYANTVNCHGETGKKVNGWDFRTCTFLFVESNINTHYRHRPSDEPKQDYYPHQIDKIRLLNEWFPFLENIRAYNTQYSYENNVIESYVGGSTNITVSDFENRTIYSEKAAEDDTLDSYRSFLVSDFYDLPSEKGPIWDTFVEFNTLFMHTPKALWQTFAEGQATIKGSNISDAVLGTSSLFARPAQEVLETDGGYGGSISQFGGAHTQLGYIFADILQGKIFLVGATKGGTILKEISKEGISTDMHKELSLGITKIDGQVNLSNVATLKGHLIDNPYMGIGIVSGYDYKLNRYLITKFPVFTENPNATPSLIKQSDGFTLSYAKDIGKWFNYHSYKPNIYIAYNNRLLFVDSTDTTSEFHEMNIGPKGSYFGTVYNSELTFVVSTKGQTCTFNNIVINSISKDRNTNIKQQGDNFYQFSAHNDKSNTGTYTMLPSNTFGITVAAGQLTVKHRNNEYRMTIPRDSVKDNSADIFDTTNLDNTIKFRERIKGDYIIINLKYDNTNNFEFVLNFIKTIFTNNFR